MKFKQTWKRHGNDGFTLVELIVVIAIMAILGGVGTAGYSGYIKSANKGADKTLVGNVIRAVETGHNSYAFQLNEVLQAAANEGIQIPVGFVVLKQDGTSTLQSSSQMTDTGVKCNVIECWVGTAEDSWTVGEGCEAETYNCLVNGAIHVICTTHTEELQQVNKTIYKEKNSTEEQVTLPCYTVSDKNALVTDHTNGDILDPTNFKVYSNSSATPNADGTIKEALVAAFGANYSNAMKLKYDGWNTASISSLYTNATDIWTLFEQKADLATSLGKAFLDQKYDDSAKLIADYAKTIISRYDESQFITIWDSIYSSDDINATVGATGAEDAFYFAGRSAWNTCLAAYVKEHSTCNQVATHSTAIENYGEGFLDYVIPKAVVSSSFTEDKQGTLSIKKIGCETCQKVAEQYTTSGASTADAKALYQTYQTVNATNTGGVIDGDSNVDFFDYYNSYMQEMDTLYTAVNSGSAENRIVIAFYYQNGVLTYEVSDPEADPRNDT